MNFGKESQKTALVAPAAGSFRSVLRKLLLRSVRRHKLERFFTNKAQNCSGDACGGLFGFKLLTRAVWTHQKGIIGQPLKCTVGGPRHFFGAGRRPAPKKYVRVPLTYRTPSQAGLAPPLTLTLPSTPPCPALPGGSPARCTGLGITSRGN